MNALQVRDSIFSELHTLLLKPRGYRKSGSWSVKQVGQIRIAAYLRSSRWNDKGDVQFWIDLHMFHEGWYTLLRGSSVFPKLTEGTPSLIYEILGSRDGPQHRLIQINAATDIPALRQTLASRMVQHLIPLEEQCSSLPGALEYIRSSNEWPTLALSAAGICLLEGDEVRAREYMALAKQNALHESSTQWLARQEQAMWQNKALLSQRTNEA